MRFEAIIAAGGYATRFDDIGPKSLLIVGQATLLEMAIRSALRAGVRRILVANNREDFHAEIMRRVSGITEVDLILDPGYENTYLLARAAAYLAAPRFLFCYGHAPRPSRILSAMRNERAPLVACGFHRSTKRKVIMYNEQYLEPPFLVEREMIIDSDAQNWTAFFAERRSSMRVIAVDGSPEFNSAMEAEQYGEYLRQLDEFDQLQGVAA